MNSVMNRIRNTLDTFIDGAENMKATYYGSCNVKELALWNYFVFNRKRTKRSANSRDSFQTDYEIHIIHENFIPEGFVEKVVKALLEPSDKGTKLKVTADDIGYNYIFKNNTNIVVEIATITVTHPTIGGV